MAKQSFLSLPFRYLMLSWEQSAHSDEHDQRFRCRWGDIRRMSCLVALSRAANRYPLHLKALQPRISTFPPFRRSNAAPLRHCCAKLRCYSVFLRHTASTNFSARRFAAQSQTSTTKRKARLFPSGLFRDQFSARPYIWSYLPSFQRYMA